MITAGAADSIRRWQTLISGKEDSDSELDEEDRPRARQTNRPGAGLIAEPGAADPEHPAAHQGGVMALQRKLARFTDAYNAKALLDNAKKT